MDVSALVNYTNLWNNLIQACERFIALRDAGRELLPNQLVAQAEAALIDLSSLAKGFQAPAVALATIIDRIETPESAEIARRFQEYLIVSGAVGLPERLAHINLPEPFLAWYPRWLDMMFVTITGLQVPYPDVMDDSFIKDLRFVLGLSVPAGAGVVDLKSTIGAGTLLRNYARIGIGRAVKYSWLGSRRTWHRSHVESRMLDAFNEPGRDRLYRAVATLLRRNPSAGGFVSSSWFNDPKIWEISPRLAYLSRNPSRNGAFLVCDGQAEIHTHRALAKSSTRRRLYDEGRYQPTCFTVIWPKEALLSWVDNNPDPVEDGA